MTALLRLEVMPPHVRGVSVRRVTAAITGLLTRLFFIILASRFSSGLLIQFRGLSPVEFFCVCV